MEQLNYDLLIAQDLRANDFPFAALIIAAMMKADNKNLELLKVAFPKEWEIVQNSHKYLSN